MFKLYRERNGVELNRVFTPRKGSQPRIAIYCATPVVFIHALRVSPHVELYTCEPYT